MKYHLNKSILLASKPPNASEQVFVPYPSSELMDKLTQSNEPFEEVVVRSHTGCIHDHMCT